MILKDETQNLFEKECCSLELSEKLHEIGIKQQSLFLWVPLNISAFTASELLNITSQYIETGINESTNTFYFNLDIRRIYVNEKLLRMYSINYAQSIIGTSNFVFQLFSHQIMDEKPANVFAKNIIHLHENNFLTIGK